MSVDIDQRCEVPDGESCRTKALFSEIVVAEGGGEKRFLKDGEKKKEERQTQVSATDKHCLELDVLKLELELELAGRNPACRWVECL